MIEPGMIIWSIGWLGSVLAFPFMLKASQKDHEERADTAPLRSAWMDRTDRAALIIALFLIWPVIVWSVITYFAGELWDWMPWRGE